MSWIKSTLRFLRTRRHPDEIARDVETELRFHIEMRARANIEDGMKPDEAQLAARRVSETSIESKQHVVQSAAAFPSIPVL